MDIHVIACKVLQSEITERARRVAHRFTYDWLRQGLHETPELLSRELKNAVRRAPECELIAIGYGLCSNGVIGLSAVDTPLLIPKTDDCIALFLGSQARYMKCFSENPGTYWTCRGWLESAYVPTPEKKRERADFYAERYGEENAAFLMRQDEEWTEKYSRCGYISCGDCSLDEKHSRTARETAACNGWSYFEIAGDTALIDALVSASRSPELLYVPCGFEVYPTFDENKIACRRVTAKNTLTVPHEKPFLPNN